MTKLWKGEYDAEGKRTLEAVESFDLKIDRPTVIFYSGFSTINRNKAMIAGALKRLELMFGINRTNTQDMKLYSGSYRGLTQLFNAIAYNCFPKRYFSNSAKKMTRDVILPLVADNIVLDDKRRFVSAEKIPLEEARRRLRNLTMMGYSMGTVLTQEMYNASTKFMLKMGYSKEETKSLLGEVVLLSLGTMSRPSKEGDRFKTVYMIASNDAVVRQKNILWFSIPEMIWRWLRPKKLNIRELANNTLYITAPVKKRMQEENVKPDGTKEKKDILLLFPSSIGLYSHHELPHYITQCDQENAFSKIATFVLVNAVHRQNGDYAIDDVVDLIRPLSGSITSGFNPSNDEIAAYKAKINEAYRGTLKERMANKEQKAVPAVPVPVPQPS